MTTRDEGLSNLEGKYDGYTVYDRDGDKIGKVDELFVDENDREEYIGVKMGLFGLSGTTLIPIEIVTVDDGDKSLRVGETKERIKDAPNYSNEDDIGPEYENRVLQHFGLSSSGSSENRGSYGRSPDTGQTGTGDGESDGGREGYGSEDASATGTSATGSGSSESDTSTMGSGSSGQDAEGGEGSGGEVERGGSGEGGAVGYRDNEAQDQGEGMGLTTRRRRVRRRSLREENEEVFEEEETSGRSE